MYAVRLYLDEIFFEFLIDPFFANYFHNAKCLDQLRCTSKIVILIRIRNMCARIETVFDTPKIQKLNIIFLGRIFHLRLQSHWENVEAKVVAGKVITFSKVKIRIITVAELRFISILLGGGSEIHKLWNHWYEKGIDIIFTYCENTSLSIFSSSFFRKNVLKLIKSATTAMQAKY